MKRKIIAYSDEELAWIQIRRGLPRRELHEKFCRRFDRSDVSLDNFKALCKRKGWFTGRTGQFAPGQEPANKGKKRPYNPNSARTQFKKGHQPHNSKPVGHEREHKDGYLYISIAEKNPHTGGDRRFVLKHKHLWEKENGPLPEGMALKCLDGNKHNTDPSNWEPIPRGALPLINGRWTTGYNDAAPEVKPTILALAKLKLTRATIIRAEKEEKEL